MVTYTFVWDVICPQLVKAGFASPRSKSVREALTAGLESLPTKLVRSTPDTQLCSFAHVLNLRWASLLEHMDSCASESAPEWTEQLALHHSALLVEMAGTVSGADEAMDMDAWAEHIRNTLLRLLKVEVPTRLILSVMSPVVPFHVAPYTCQWSAPLEIWPVQQACRVCIGCSSKSHDPR